jgi:superfamily II DNA or RNA helicase
MSHKQVSRRGYILHKDKLTFDEKKKILQDLTVTPMVLPTFQFGNSPRKFNIYLESEKRYYLPRHYGIKHFGTPIETSIKAGLDIDIQVPYDLLPHQHDGYKKILDTLENVGGGIFSLYCGGGKTFISIKTIAKIKKKTLVVVNKEFLMDQWTDSIHKFSNARVGYIQQDKILTENTDIVIAMLHSLCLKEYPIELFDQFGYVIFDECHHLASEMFSKALPKVATTYTLGLSATPHRKDGLAFVFEYYLGSLFYFQKRKGNNNVQIKQIICSSKHQDYETIFLKNGTKNTVKMQTNLTEFTPRNQLIYTILDALCQQKRKILVLSLRREHLKTIADMLNTKAIIINEDDTIVNKKKSLQPHKNKKTREATFGFYYGRIGMNKKNYKTMLDDSTNCDIILGTFAIASEALDIGTLNTAVFLSSTTDVEQAVGRILRKTHTDINPMVVDICDKMGNFMAHWSKRKNYYKEQSYDISSLSISLDKLDTSSSTKLDKFLKEKNKTNSDTFSSDDETISDTKTTPFISKVSLLDD